MRLSRIKRINVLGGIGAFVVLIACLSVVACNESQVKADANVAEAVLEPIVDTALHLPSGTAQAAVGAIEAELAPTPAAVATPAA